MTTKTKRSTGRAADDAEAAKNAIALIVRGEAPWIDGAPLSAKLLALVGVKHHFWRVQNLMGDRGYARKVNGRWRICKPAANDDTPKQSRRPAALKQAGASKTAAATPQKPGTIDKVAFLQDLAALIGDDKKPLVEEIIKDVSDFAEIANVVKGSMHS